MVPSAVNSAAAAGPSARFQASTRAFAVATDGQSDAGRAGVGDGVLVVAHAAMTTVRANATARIDRSSITVRR